MIRIVFYVNKDLAASYKDTRKKDIFALLTEKFKKELGKDAVKYAAVEQSCLTLDMECEASSDDIRSFVYDSVELNEEDARYTRLSVITVGDGGATSLEKRNQKNNRQAFQGYVAQINGLRAHLTDKVHGQPHAINEVCAELLNASIHYRDDATFPLSVLTFLGPHGVGKTLMATEIATYLNEQSGIAYKLFCRADYEDEGFPRALADFVYNNPACILVFNDAEEFYGYINGMLREIFNAGTYRNVSFRKAVMIFTSCIGESVYANSFTGNLSNLSKKSLVKAMNEEKVEGSNIGAFAYYVAQGLAKGRVIPFNYLEPHVLKQLVKAELGHTFANFAHKTGIKVDYDGEELATALLYMCDRDYNAQAIKEFLADFLNKELVDLFSQRSPDSGESLLQSLAAIHYEVELKKAPAAVQRLFEENEQTILVLCDKEQAPFFEALSLPLVKLVVATDKNGAKAALRSNVDCILLDVLMGAKKRKTVPTDLADYDCEGVSLFHYVTTYYNGIPLYVLSDGAAGYARERYVTFLNGIARDVIFVDTAAPDSFLADMARIQTSLELCADIDMLVRENKKLSYNAKQLLSKDGTGVTVQLADLSLEHASRELTRKAFAHNKAAVKFADIVGQDNAKAVLQFYASFLTERSAVRKNGLQSPKGILLYGANGTGKTILAKAVAGETSSTLVRQNVGDLLSRNHYNSEKYMEELSGLFKKAKDSSPAVLLLENVDELVENGEEADVKAFINEMENLNPDENHPVLLIATTRYDKDLFPDSFIRHFDRAIGLLYPKEHERELFIRTYLERRGITSLSDAIIKNFAVRTCWGTYAYIENILDFVIRNSHGESITDAMLIEAIDLYNYGEERKNNPEEDLKTAYHEMGHYLIEYLCGNRPSFVTIVTRGYYLGYTMTDLHEERSSQTRQHYLDDICCLFGGRAAECIIYGEEGINTGVGSDIAAATRRAYRMVCNFGMGKFLFTVDGLPSRMIPTPMLEEIDKILHEQYERAVNLLRKNIDKLELLTKELVKKKSLIGAECEKLLSKDRK